MRPFSSFFVSLFGRRKDAARTRGTLRGSSRRTAKIAATAPGQERVVYLQARQVKHSDRRLVSPFGFGFLH